MSHSNQNGSVLIIVMVFLMIVAMFYAHMVNQAQISSYITQNFIEQLKMR